MGFLAHQRRFEHTDNAQIACGYKFMAIMLVERIHHPRCQSICLATRAIGNSPFTVDDQVRLDMIFVLHHLPGTGSDRCLCQGEADAIVTQQIA